MSTVIQHIEELDHYEKIYTDARGVLGEHGQNEAIEMLEQGYSAWKYFTNNSLEQAKAAGLYG
jgi:hypothetical protein